MTSSLNLNVLERIKTTMWAFKNLPIRVLGDSALETVCTPFKNEEFGGEEMNKVARDLVKTIKRYRKKTGTGRGFAANQIGYARRMIIVWLGEKPEIFVNPEVVKLTGKGSYWESCLSGGVLLIGKVIRPWAGSFKYQDLRGKEHLIEANEFQTRIFLHEMDHLDGISCQEKYEPGTMKFITGGKEEILGYKFEKLG